MRLGVYSDIGYVRDGAGISSHQPFVRFLQALEPHVSELSLFGRLSPAPGREAYRLGDGPRFVALPYYASASSPRSLAVVRSTVSTVTREARLLDAVIVFGPGVVANALARAVPAACPVCVAVRQEYVPYLRHRVGARAVPPAWLLERGFRRRARQAPTVVVGAALASRFAAGQPLLDVAISLVSEDDVVSSEHVREKSWDDGRLRLLSVGRLEPEKNPLLLVDVLAGLRRRDPRWHLTVVGDGALRPALEQRARASGLADQLSVASHVPNGPQLWGLYRGSHVLLHVSRTEGVPQVFAEAGAAGLAIVATDVGGVRGSLRDAGVLVPPRDCDAAVAAVARVAGDPQLRQELALAGLELARRQTLESQSALLVSFVERCLGNRPRMAGGRAQALNSRRLPVDSDV
jgi:glycosyltransferase involved in cell wall biosynthesis